MGIKCDQCKAVQNGPATHWVRITVFRQFVTKCVGVVLGEADVMAVGQYTDSKKTVEDLCGQGCLFRRVAELLGLDIRETLNG